MILSDRFITEQVGGEVDGVKPGEAGEEWGDGAGGETVGERERRGDSGGGWHSLRV